MQLFYTDQYNSTIMQNATFSHTNQYNLTIMQNRMCGHPAPPPNHRKALHNTVPPGGTPNKRTKRTEQLLIEIIAN